MTGIVKDTRILAGKPTVAGTGIPVTLVLNLLAHGQTFDEIIYAQEAIEKIGPRNVDTPLVIIHNRKNGRFTTRAKDLN